MDSIYTSTEVSIADRELPAFELRGEVSRPATLPPRVTNKARNRSTDQQNDQYGITMCRYNTYT